MPFLRSAAILLILLGLSSDVSARWASVASLATGSHGGHGHDGGSPAMTGHPTMGPHPHQGFPGAGNVINVNPGIFVGYGVGGVSYYSPTFFFVGQGGFPPIAPSFPVPAFSNLTAPSWPIGQGGGPGGLMLPMPDGQGTAQVVARPRRPNPNRARELVEMGDRSFRGANTRRAEDRYQLAIKADPTSPIPSLHLAQVALVRKDYEAVAGHLRAAVGTGAGSGWLLNAPDIQAMFAEPGDFARHLAGLESHLQANPNDRDAWFVLGAEWYLSGRTQQAADVFQRLADRRPDEALSAFLEASNAEKPRIH